MNAFELMARDQKQEAPHGQLIRDLQKEKIGDLMFRIVEGYLPFMKGHDIIPVLKEFLMKRYLLSSGPKIGEFVR